MNVKKRQEILYAAGKLAVAAGDVLSAQLGSARRSIARLDKALRHYDSLIMSYHQDNPPEDEVYTRLTEKEQKKIASFVNKMALHFLRDERDHFMDYELFYQIGEEKREEANLLWKRQIERCIKQIEGK